MRSLFVYVCPFNSNNDNLSTIFDYTWKKRSCCAWHWHSNVEQRDGRRRHIHWSMTTILFLSPFSLSLSLCLHLPLPFKRPWERVLKSKTSFKSFSLFIGSWLYLSPVCFSILFIVFIAFSSHFFSVYISTCSLSFYLTILMIWWKVYGKPSVHLLTYFRLQRFVYKG